MDSKAVVKPAIVLLLISAIAAGILGVVSEVTAAPIAAQNEKSLNEGMQAVMPDASSFELLDADLTGTITAVYKGDNGGFGDGAVIVGQFGVFVISQLLEAGLGLFNHRALVAQTESVRVIALRRFGV